MNYFFNEINCKQSLISIWKKIFKTVHQLSYFVGHPVCHRIDLFCSYFKTRGATKSHSYTSSVIYTWSSPSIYFAVYDYVPGFWNLKIDLILVSGSMCTFLWSGVLFDNNCAKACFYNLHRDKFKMKTKNKMPNKLENFPNFQNSQTFGEFPKIQSFGKFTKFQNIPPSNFYRNLGNLKNSPNA